MADDSKTRKGGSNTERINLMTKYHQIPDELKTLNQWVCAIFDSKVPMRSWEAVAASSTNPSTWSDFTTAYESVEKYHLYDNVGFVFSGGYVGIDIDDGFDEYGLISEKAADIIHACESYTEKSRSGRGFHIILKGELPFKGKNNRDGVEIYKTGRYFILTGDTMLYNSISENQQAIDYVVNKYFAEVRDNEKEPVFGKRAYNPRWENVEKGRKLKIRPTYPIINEGCRNLSLCSVAGAMHTIGYSKEQILTELKVVNQRACKPPLSEYELRSICNSITRYRRN